MAEQAWNNAQEGAENPDARQDAFLDAALNQLVVLSVVTYRVI